MRKTSFISHQHRQPGILARLAAMSLISLGMILCVAAPAGAATINVNATIDDLTVNTNCTLREAIQAANTNAAVDACTAGSAGLDTINIPAGTYTITLAGANENLNLTGDFNIWEAVNITGAGATTTIIDGGGVDRIFHIDPTFAGGFTATINDLTLQNGVHSGTGGAIRVGLAGLVLNRCVVSGNSAFNGGGVYAFGSLTVTNTTFTNNSTTGNSGGGISCSGCTLTVVDSTFVQNSAPSLTRVGGGVAMSDGELGPCSATITNTTFNGNSAGGEGGAIYNACRTLNLTNSTLSGNTAGTFGGGIYSTPGFGGAPWTTNITNSTITANNIQAPAAAGLAGLQQNFTPMLAVVRGGGIHSIIGTVINLKNTIVANQLSGSDCNVAVNTSLNDLDSDGSCGVGALSIKNPLLGPLSNNGGPTQTHALLTGSPAFDAGDPTTCTNAPVNNLDQRGITRPQGPDCDIGSFELEVAPPAPTCTKLLTLSPFFFNKGNQLDLGVQFVPWAGASTADAYVSVRTPGGTFLFLQLDGTFAVVPTPMLSNWTVAPFNGLIFSYIFDGSEATGLYTVYASFKTPGTFNATGPKFCPKSFSFIP